MWVRNVNFFRASRSEGRAKSQDRNLRLAIRKEIHLGDIVMTEDQRQRSITTFYELEEAGYA